MNQKKILVIIPCFNESKNISTLLDEIESLESNYHVLVVDDGSTDNTYELARYRVFAIRLLTNLGIGGAVQTGFKYAELNGFDFCVQIDGDGQHPPDQIKKLINTYEKTPGAIVVGSRFLGNDTFQSTYARRLGGKWISFLLSKLFSKYPVSDPTSGLRLLDRKAIALFARNYPSDFPEPISLALALKLGFRVIDVAVDMRSRKHGQSSIIGFKPIAYMFRVVVYMVLIKLRPPIKL